MKNVFKIERFGLTKTVKMKMFDVLNSQNLIARKIWEEEIHSVEIVEISCQSELRFYMKS